MKRADVVGRLIYPAIDEIADGAEKDLNLVKVETTELFGPRSALDSVGLVNLIVIVEEAIERETGRTIRLVSERAMSRRHSPFKTVASLAEYIEELLGEEDK
jgi:acyl carrier protein